MPTKKKKTVEDLDVRSMARAYTDMSVRVLAGIAENGKVEAARVASCAQLLDRGWGKAAQPLTGAGGDQSIEVTIRTIIEGSKKK
jgi:hypothetical protein